MVAHGIEAAGPVLGGLPHNYFWAWALYQGLDTLRRSSQYNRSVRNAIREIQTKIEVLCNSIELLLREGSRRVENPKSYRELRGRYVEEVRAERRSKSKLENCYQLFLETIAEISTAAIDLKTKLKPGQWILSLIQPYNTPGGRRSTDGTVSPFRTNIPVWLQSSWSVSFLRTMSILLRKLKWSKPQAAWTKLDKKSLLNRRKLVLLEKTVRMPWKDRGWQFSTSHCYSPAKWIDHPNISIMIKIFSKEFDKPPITCALYLPTRKIASRASKSSSLGICRG